MSSVYGKARMDAPGAQGHLFTSGLKPTHWKVRWQHKRFAHKDGKFNWHLDRRQLPRERLYPKMSTAKGQATRLENMEFFVVELIPCVLIEHESLKSW